MIFKPYYGNVVEYGKEHNIFLTMWPIFYLLQDGCIPTLISSLSPPYCGAGYGPPPHPRHAEGPAFSVQALCYYIIYSIVHLVYRYGIWCACRLPSFIETALRFKDDSSIQGFWKPWVVSL